MQGVIDRAGVADALAQIQIPCLIIVGDQDTATPVEKSERMRRRIPGANMVVIPGAGHTSTVEESAAVNVALKSFLDDLSDDSK